MRGCLGNENSEFERQQLKVTKTKRRAKGKLKNKAEYREDLWTEEQTDKRTDGRMNGHGLKDKYMDGRIDGHTDGRSGGHVCQIAQKRSLSLLFSRSYFQRLSLLFDRLTNVWTKEMNK